MMNTGWWQTAKSGFFVVESEEAAEGWVQRIARALRQHGAENRERKPSSNAAAVAGSSTTPNHHGTIGSSSSNSTITTPNGYNHNINNNVSCART